PLRERREDIPALVERQLARLNERYGRDKILSRDVWQLLMGWDWPGNVRELENVLERAWLASEDVIDAQVLAPSGSDVQSHAFIPGAGASEPSAPVAQSLEEGEGLKAVLAR